MLNTGLIGSGVFAQNMLRAIADTSQSRLATVCDLSPARLAAVAERYPEARTTSDAEDVFADPDVQVVYIATPPASHADLTRRALQAGKHVLVEKPLTTKGDEAAEMVRLAAENERVLMVGHTLLYSPPVLKVKELITKGTVGDIFYVDSQRVNLGRHQDAGVLWDFAPHDLSIILFWLNEVPTAVYATSRSFVAAGTEDVVFVTLDFPSGALAQIQLSWLAPTKLRRTTISGSQRMVIYDDLAGPEAIKVFDRGVDGRTPSSFGEFQLSYRQGDIWIPRLDTFEPIKAEWEHFLECVRSGTQPRSHSLSGYWTVKIIEAAERSFRSHARETVDWSAAPEMASRTSILSPTRAQPMENF